jgi:hypothetical protein
VSHQKKNDFVKALTARQLDALTYLALRRQHSSGPALVGRERYVGYVVAKQLREMGLVMLEDAPRSVVPVTKRPPKRKVDTWASITQAGFELLEKDPLTIGGLSVVEAFDALGAHKASLEAFREKVQSVKQRKRRKLPAVVTPPPPPVVEPLTGDHALVQVSMASFFEGDCRGC